MRPSNRRMEEFKRSSCVTREKFGEDEAMTVSVLEVEFGQRIGLGPCPSSDIKSESMCQTRIDCGHPRASRPRTLPVRGMQKPSHLEAIDEALKYRMFSDSSLSPNMYTLFQCSSVPLIKAPHNSVRILQCRSARSSVAQSS